jgi:gamma-glutamylcyclotransferase (GGCT)/AIG2-like uncharacterized protein YtfP
MSPPPVQHIFVYGTLQRGQCRERCWPHPPLRVDAATIHAALYDLGPYPAIGPGDDVVRGEVWEISAEHLAATLQALDDVEGYSQLGDDLYVRRLVQCRLEDGREIAAWTYYYGNASRLAQHQLVPPNSAGEVLWREQPGHVRGGGG